jgi:dienelactone hydrolase
VTESALRSSRRRNAYGGVRHSFTNPAADRLTIPGFGYDLQADRRSWQSMLGLFSHVLGPA